MDAGRLTADDSAGRLGPTRARVLAMLQDVDSPLTASALAERMGLHPNTARFHLEALESADLVVRRSEDRSSPGRPRALFTAAPGGPGVARRSYRLLAEILTSYLTDQLPDPGASAQEAGSAWGRHLAGPTPPIRRMDATTAVDELVERLDTIGFESHPAGQEDDLRLEVHHCPFLEVAEDHREVICAVHLGLMKGVLEQMRAPVVAESLEPLVEPSRCIAHLRTVPPND